MNQIIARHLWLVDHNDQPLVKVFSESVFNSIPPTSNPEGKLMPRGGWIEDSNTNTSTPDQPPPRLFDQLGADEEE